MINAVNISSECVNDGISLDVKLNDEYPEIKLLSDAANTMKNASGSSIKENVYKTYQDCIMSDLK